jgi:hypothetical protein
MRAKLIFACLALGGLVSCAASTPTGPSPAAVSMASSDPNVGKEFWLMIPEQVSTVPDMVTSVDLPTGTHFKIDGVEQDVIIVNGTRYPGSVFFYRMILDDGRTVYLSTNQVKVVASAVPPENLSKVSDREIVGRVIQESRGSYEGQCACPDDRSYSGSACGGRSAYSKKRGIKCYPGDVSKAEIAGYRATPHFRR